MGRKEILTKTKNDSLRHTNPYDLSDILREELNTFSFCDQLRSATQMVFTASKNERRKTTQENMASKNQQENKRRKTEENKGPRGSENLE